MKKTIFLTAIIAFLVVSPRVNAQPAKVVKSQNSVLACYPGKIYKNQLATIVKVYKPTEDTYPLLNGKNEPGLKYIYNVRYSGGFVDTIFVIYSKSNEIPELQVKPKVGMYYFWTPASRDIRKLHPKEDRHVPMIMAKDCSQNNQVDTSVKAADIPWFN